MRTTSELSLRLVAVGILVLVIASPARLRAQQHPAEAVRIGDNDLGGVVTSAQGPEAGVWVIAETTDLPTKFAKIVVTDAQGRYVMPDLPNANYSVWVRGYGLVDAPKVQATPGKILNLQAVLAPNAAAAAEYYPAIYWYADAQDPGQERVPRHRAWWQWHATEPEESGGLAGQREVPRLHVVSRPGHDWDTHDSEGTGCIQGFDRSVGQAHHGRTSHDPDGQRPRQTRDAARAHIVRRLDRSYRRWRTAVRQAGAAARDGAQRGPHPVGLEPPHGLPARFDRDRPAQADALSPMASSTGRRKKARITRRSSIR